MRLVQIAGCSQHDYEYVVPAPHGVICIAGFLRDLVETSVK
jgi:hypothetical protein